jgi:CHASE2 domain-containing sensor protein
VEQTEQLIGICVNQTEDGGSIAPPPEIASERIGFADIFPDRDRVLRRLVYGINPNQTCPTTISFSLLVALHYLAGEGISFTPQAPRQLGQAFLSPWEDDAGGYHLSDGEARGEQLLLNYRANREVAEQVTLEEVLRDRLKPEQVRDRIVLIGTVAREFRDYHATPSDSEVPGVLIQAQMVSQFLSAAVDRRPIVTYWPPTGEMLWTWLWGLIGGLIAWRWRSPLGLVLAAVVSTTVLYGLCYVFLVQGTWVIFVSPLLASLLAGGTVAISRSIEDRG